MHYYSSSTFNLHLNHCATYRLIDNDIECLPHWCQQNVRRSSDIFECMFSGTQTDTHTKRRSLSSLATVKVNFHLKHCHINGVWSAQVHQIARSKDMQSQKWKQRITLIAPLEVFHMIHVRSSLPARPAEENAVSFFYRASVKDREKESTCAVVEIENDVCAHN